MVVAQAVATIALGLLGASGVAKLIDPDPTTGAMAAGGLISSNLMSRLIGVTEVAAATIGLTVGGWGLVAGSVLYLSFAVFTLFALRRNLPIRSCGCFGREDTPPTVFHVAYNLIAAFSMIVLSLGRDVPVDWSLDVAPLSLYLGFAAVGVYASYLMLARLPSVLATSRSI